MLLQPAETADCRHSSPGVPLNMFSGLQARPQGRLRSFCLRHSSHRPAPASNAQRLSIASMKGVLASAEGRPLGYTPPQAQKPKTARRSGPLHLRCNCNSIQTLLELRRRRQALCSPLLTPVINAAARRGLHSHSRTDFQDVRRCTLESPFTAS